MLEVSARCAIKIYLNRLACHCLHDNIPAQAEMQGHSELVKSTSTIKAFTHSKAHSFLAELDHGTLA